MSAARSDFAITVLDVELVLAQQPLAQVAVDLIHTFSEFVSGNIAEVGNLRACLDSLFKSAGKGIGVSFDQTNESVGKHHNHPPSLSPEIDTRPSFTPQA